MMNKLGLVLAGIALITAGAGVAIIKKRDSEDILEEELTEIEEG